MYNPLRPYFEYRLMRQVASMLLIRQPKGHTEEMYIDFRNKALI